MSNPDPGSEIERIVTRLGLEPHPEGGWYRRTWRSDEGIDAPALPPRYGAPRILGSAILYLISRDSPSRFHRVRSDELLHHYAGDAAVSWRLLEGGGRASFMLGRDLEGGQIPQLHVPRGCWQATEIAPGGRWALLGATVVPGFEFEDFELGVRAELERGWPDHRELLARLA